MRTIKRLTVIHKGMSTMATNDRVSPIDVRALTEHELIAVHIARGIDADVRGRVVDAFCDYFRVTSMAFPLRLFVGMCFKAKG